MSQQVWKLVIVGEENSSPRNFHQSFIKRQAGHRVHCEIQLVGKAAAMCAHGRSNRLATPLSNVKIEVLQLAPASWLDQDSSMRIEKPSFTRTDFDSFTYIYQVGSPAAIHKF